MSDTLHVKFEGPGLPYVAPGEHAPFVLSVSPADSYEKLQGQVAELQETVSMLLRANETQHQARQTAERALEQSEQRTRTYRALSRGIIND